MSTLRTSLLAILALTLGLAACTPKPAADGAAANTLAGTAAPAQSARAAADTGPTLQEALQFIEVRLSRRRTAVGTWEPHEVSLAAPVWTWREMQVISGDGNTETEKMLLTSLVDETYRVAPEELSLPVRVKDSAVLFECAKSECFTVKKRVTFPGLGNDPIQDGPEVRSHNLWHFGSPEEAQRVANALNVALEKLGSQRSKF